MESERRRLRLASLIAALAILPLTPLVTSVVYRLTSGLALPTSTGIGAYLHWHTTIWTVLFVAFAVALVPAGLILMRRPNVPAPWAMGLMTIALGLIGVVYAATRLVLDLPEASPVRIRMVVALSIVPAAAGVLLLRKRGISGVQALGILAISLGIVGSVYRLPRIPFVLTAEVPSSLLVAQLASAISMSITPLIVGYALIRGKELSIATALGIMVIMLGVIGALFRADLAVAYLLTLEQWHPPVVVELSMITASTVGPTIVGILMVRKKELPVVSAIGLTAIALGLIGTTYGVSSLMSIELLDPGSLFAYAIVLPVLLFVPLIAALGLAPLSAGVVLVRRAHASGAWALGLMAIVLGVVGTTFSAAQLIASGAPSLFNLFVGIHLLNTAWLP